MNRPYDFVSFEELPRADGSLAPDAVKTPGVTALTSRIVAALTGCQTGQAEFIEATYTPSAADLTWFADRRHHFCGWVRHRLHLPRRRGRPVILFVYGPCYEIAKDDGDHCYRWAPLPEDFDPDRGLFADLEAEIIERLGRHSIADCVRWSLVPAPTIETIWDSLMSWHRDAMRAGDAEPQHLAVTRVSLPGKAGAGGEALHVVAGDFEAGRAWTMAVLDWALGAADLAACLAEELTTLPDPNAVRSIIAPPDRSTRAIVREALVMTPSSIPGFAASMGQWRRDAPDCEGLAVFAGVVEELDRRLQALVREVPLTVEDLERRAVIRQGYEAAVSWRRGAPLWRS